MLWKRERTTLRPLEEKADFMKKQSTKYSKIISTKVTEKNIRKSIKGRDFKLKNSQNMFIWF